MRKAVLLLVLLLSGCANFQLPSWMGGKTHAPESKPHAPPPAAAPAPSAPPASVNAQQPARPGPVAPLPGKRKYEED